MSEKNPTINNVEEKEALEEVKDISLQDQNPIKKENEEEALEKTVEEMNNVRQMSPASMVLKRFFRSKLSVVGLVMIVFLFVFSFLGPYIFMLLDKIDFLDIITVWAKDGIDSTNGKTSLVETPITFYANGQKVFAYEVFNYVGSDNILGGISAEHWLGTDSNGFDVFTRLMYGGRISLVIGFVVIILETALGVVIGGISGYFGKWVDQIIMRIVDIFNCIPTLPILLIASALLDSWGIDGDIRIIYLMGILTIFGWSGTARLVRGQILYLREQEYMVACEVMGYPTMKKIFGQLIPNVFPQLIVSATLGLGSVILYESTLSYLGLGVQGTTPSWGSMISSANNAIYLNNYPLLWVPAGICIIIAVLGFNFIGDGLRDAFDPKSRR